MNYSKMCFIFCLSGLSIFVQATAFGAESDNVAMKKFFGRIYYQDVKTIYANSIGIIAEIYVAPGDVVKENQPLVRVENLDIYFKPFIIRYHGAPRMVSRIIRDKGHKVIAYGEILSLVKPAAYLLKANIFSKDLSSIQKGMKVEIQLHPESASHQQVQGEVIAIHTPKNRSTTYLVDVLINSPLSQPIPIIASIASFTVAEPVVSGKD
jgi:hypothetical protein